MLKDTSEGEYSRVVRTLSSTFTCTEFLDWQTASSTMDINSWVLDSGLTGWCSSQDSPEKQTRRLYILEYMFIDI